MLKTIVVAASLISHAGCDEPEPVQGVVALTDSPFCEFFVVKTASGFSLLDWRGGLYVFVEGDAILGPLTTVGVHAFDLSGSGMRADVEGANVDLSRAQQSYYSRCHLKTPDFPVPVIATRCFDVRPISSRP